MTEAEWLYCGDPDEMLSALTGKSSDRRLRLFGLACCQPVGHLLVDPRTKHGLEVVERYADGLCSNEDLRALYDSAQDMAQERWQAERELLADWLGTTPDLVADWLETSSDADLLEIPIIQPSEEEMAEDALLSLLEPEDSFCGDSIRSAAYFAARAQAHRDAVRRSQCELLREIFGNPFRLIRFEPDWRTLQAVALARTFYDERRFEDLPLLADALEEAGCTDEAILSHCRGPGPHVRGCWVVDLVLNKQ